MISSQRLIGLPTIDMTTFNTTLGRVYLSSVKRIIEITVEPRVYKKKIRRYDKLASFDSEEF